jgi:hypothetical protein
MDYSQEYNLRTMNSDLPRAGLPRVGRLLGILAGLFLLALGLGLGMITYALLFDKGPPDVRGMALAGAIFSVVLWFLNLSRRLILGRSYPDGGLFSPIELRAIACFWIALPLPSLFTGSWHKPDRPLALQVLSLIVAFAFFVAIASTLFKTASSRKATSREE